MGRLTGKTAVITGATGGIGEASVVRFLSEGAKVMAIGRSAEKLARLTSRIGENPNFATFVADSTDEQATAAAMQQTEAQFGQIDILFANAGTEGDVAPLESLTADQFRAVIETNVVGVWLAMKYCAEHMKSRGTGSIVCTASIAGLVGFPNLMPYIASKHAVCGMVQTAALELGPAGVRVNAVAPGPIANRMIESLEQQMSPEDPDSVHEGIVASIPMGRYGNNEEVANLVLFLASDEASYINGATYTVDGGYTAA